MGADPRRRGSVRAAKHPHRGQGSGGGGCGDHAVELSDRGDPQQDGPGSRRRKYRGSQTGSEHAVERGTPRQARRRKDRHPSRGVQRGDHPRQRRCRSARRRPARRPPFLHWIHRGRPRLDAPSSRHDEADVPGTRGKIGSHRHRRRRPVEGDHGDDRRVLPCGSGLRGQHPNPRARVAVR